LRGGGRKGSKTIFRVGRGSESSTDDRKLEKRDEKNQEFLRKKFRIRDKTDTGGCEKTTQPRRRKRERQPK